MCLIKHFILIFFFLHLNTIIIHTLSRQFACYKLLNFINSPNRFLIVIRLYWPHQFFFIFLLLFFSSLSLVFINCWIQINDECNQNIKYNIDTYYVVWDKEEDYELCFDFWFCLITIHCDYKLPIVIYHYCKQCNARIG
jgi:hypothetical protein